MRKQVLLLAMGLAACAAQAAVYDFAYLRSADGKLLSGQLDGTLQVDGNTVVVNAVLGAPLFDGVAGPALPFVTSVDMANFGTPGLLPRVSLNGAFMDITACSTAQAGCPDTGFVFAAGNQTATTFNGGNPFAAFGGAYGLSIAGMTVGYAEPFLAANWSLTAAAVPEPASWALLLAGAGAFVAVRRRAAACA